MSKPAEPPADAAATSCAAPYLQIGDSVERPIVRAGSHISVAGRAFARGCGDMSGQPAWGCSTPDEAETSGPMKDVTLLIRQGFRDWELASEDAGAAADNHLGHITWEVTVPAGLGPGRAVLVAETATLPVVVEVP